jgi:hypothetical protein
MKIKAVIFVFVSKSDGSNRYSFFEVVDTATGKRVAGRMGTGDCTSNVKSAVMKVYNIGYDGFVYSTAEEVPRRQFKARYDQLPFAEVGLEEFLQKNLLSGE